MRLPLMSSLLQLEEDEKRAEKWRQEKWNNDERREREKIEKRKAVRAEGPVHVPSCSK